MTKLTKTELKQLIREQVILNEDLSLDVQPFLRMLLEAGEGLTEVAQRTKNPWIGMLAKFVSSVSNKANSAAEEYFSKQNSTGLR
jgi:hypothetical protein